MVVVVGEEIQTQRHQEPKNISRKDREIGRLALLIIASSFIH